MSLVNPAMMEQLEAARHHITMLCRVQHHLERALDAAGRVTYPEVRQSLVQILVDANDELRAAMAAVSAQVLKGRIETGQTTLFQEEEK